MSALTRFVNPHWKYIEAKNVEIIQFDILEKEYSSFYQFNVSFLHFLYISKFFMNVKEDGFCKLRTFVNGPFQGHAWEVNYCIQFKWFFFKSSKHTHSVLQNTLTSKCTSFSLVLLCRSQSQQENSQNIRWTPKRETPDSIFQHEHRKRNDQLRYPVILIHSHCHKALHKKLHL